MREIEVGMKSGFWNRAPSDSKLCEEMRLQRVQRRGQGHFLRRQTCKGWRGKESQRRIQFFKSRRTGNGLQKRKLNEESFTEDQVSPDATGSGRTRRMRTEKRCGHRDRSHC